MIKVNSKVIISNIICFFKGHAEPEKHLIETDGYICTIRCSRCKNILMGAFTWKIKNIRPPNSTPKQIKDWEDFCENKWKQLRDSCF